MLPFLCSLVCYVIMFLQMLSFLVPGAISGLFHVFSLVNRNPAEPRIVPRAISCYLVSETTMPAPVLCVNAFSALSEESLYDFPLDLGLSVEALATVPVPRARRHCISSAGIGAIVSSGVDAQAKSVSMDTASVSNSSGPGAEVKPANLNEVTFPVLDVPELVSHTPAHIGQTFIKQDLYSKSTMPMPKPALNLGMEVTNIVYGLEIPC